MSLDTEFWIALIASGFAPAILGLILMIIMRRLGTVGGLWLTLLYAALAGGWFTAVRAIARNSGLSLEDVSAGLIAGAFVLPCVFGLLMLGGIALRWRRPTPQPAEAEAEEQPAGAQVMVDSAQVPAEEPAFGEPSEEPKIEVFVSESVAKASKPPEARPAGEPVAEAPTDESTATPA